MKKKPLIILTGPTAVGKTSLGIELAKAINAEIISADSMQVYKKMDIGTAKIKQNEMQQIKHYLIDEFMPDEEFHVVKFQEYAKRYLEEIYAKGKVPIVVGGTGFYIQALLYDIDFTQSENDYSFRRELEEIAKEKGNDYLHQMLKNLDVKAAESIHPNNVKRVIRAIEFYKQTGMEISTHNEEQRRKESPYNFAYFVLTDDRKHLYDRINLRVDQMMEEGLLKEVKSLCDEGYKDSLVSMQGLGYKEFIPYLNGDCTLEDAVYILKRDTRHFAKRQITWFKRENDVIWLDKQNYKEDSEILSKMIMILKEKDIITQLDTK